MFLRQFYVEKCGFNRFYRNMCIPFWTVRNPFRAFSLSNKYVWRFLELAWAFMQLSTGYFRSDCVKIAILYRKYRSIQHPFWSVLWSFSLKFIKQGGYACLLVYYLRLYRRFSVDFCAKSSIFEPKCGPVLSRSIRSIWNKTRSYAFLV